MYANMFYSLISADGVPEPPTTIILTVSWLAAGFIIAFAFMGVIFALVCIVMTCALRNRRLDYIHTCMSALNSIIQ